MVVEEEEKEEGTDTVEIDAWMDGNPGAEKGQT